MRIAAVLLSTLLAATACSKKNADTSEAPGKGTTGALPTPPGERIAVPGGADTGAPGEAARGGPQSKGGPDTSFQLAVVAPPAGPAGKEALAQVRVTPGEGWKMNHEYPTKLKLTPPDGVAVQKATLEVTDAKLEDKKLEFDVKVTAAKAGTYKVGGEIKFAVCTPETCDPKKQEIAFEVVAQ